MNRLIALCLTAASCLGIGFSDRSSAAEADAAASIRSMRWERRIVLIAAGDAADVALREQRRLLDSWAGASDRDVTIVEIAGDRVSGSSDIASDLRRRYHLPAEHFVVILIGKNGHVALKSASPLSADALSKTIDGMPMRRAGQR